MKQLLDTAWQRRGTSWIWDEEARNKVCSASEVWSLRQFLQAAGHWPDDLPSNGNNTLVVAGLEGGLDLLTPEDAETWLGAEESVKFGLADVVDDPVRAAAMFDVTKYGFSVPKALVTQSNAEKRRAQREQLEKLKV